MKNGKKNKKTLDVPGNVKWPDAAHSIGSRTHPDSILRERLANYKVTDGAIKLDPQAGTLGMPFTAPRTLNEELMAKIWQDILKLERIGIFENFFDVVRDSYLAMEVIEQTRKAFSVSLPLRVLFENPTVAGMTAAIQRSRHNFSQGPLSSPEVQNSPRVRRKSNRFL